MEQAAVFAVTATNFQSAVVERSHTTPVLLDFWASWCGPCRTLTPVLEKLAGEWGGAFVLGKVDTEAEEELAYAFQVQSIPLVVLFTRGRPADAFSGALPEADVIRFLERNGIRPARSAAVPPPADPGSPAARVAAARNAVLAGDLAAARAELDRIGDDADEVDLRDRLRAGLDWLGAAPDPNPGAAARALDDARAALRQKDVPRAIERILASVEADRGYQDGIARRAMLFAVALLPDGDERRDDYLRQFATALY